MNQINEKDLEKVRILGEGTYGKCYLVHNKKNDELCVLKQIQIFGMSQQQLFEVERQAKILSVLNHPCIIKFLTFFRSQGYLNILMEYADGGDLNKMIKQSKGTLFSESQILKWFTQICLAIKHIHDRKVIHRDLKCQNIFMTKDGYVKLGDFGIARHLSRTLDKIKTVVGTPYYMSPQICQNKDYSFKTDIWSLGVILYEICTHKLPFDGNSLPVLALKISKGQYTPIQGNHYSRDIKKLISSLLQSNPNRRPSIGKILQNPLIQKLVHNFLPQQIIHTQFSHTTLHSHNIFQKQNGNENGQQDHPVNNKNCFKNEIMKSFEGKKIDLGKVLNIHDDEREPQKRVQVHSARSHIQKNQKNLDFGNKINAGGNHVIHNIYAKQKKKKTQIFKKRQISEPNLAQKHSFQSKKILPIIQQTQRRQQKQQTIEDTLIMLAYQKNGQQFTHKMSILNQLDGFNEQDQSVGILSLLWGYQKFKHHL